MDRDFVDFAGLGCMGFASLDFVRSVGGEQ